MVISFHVKYKLFKQNPIKKDWGREGRLQPITDCSTGQRLVDKTRMNLLWRNQSLAISWKYFVVYHTKYNILFAKME
jgi:hypothetical protein